METLDKFDLAILRELQTDARLTNAELAQRVGLSAAPCWRRVRVLEEEGYITGYRAEINRHKIGLGVLAFVRLDAERNSGDVARKLEAAIRKIPEIVSCHYISGTGTFELQVVSQDLESFSQFAREVLKPGGFFLCKVLRGGTEGQLLAELKRDFATVRHIKPKSSRDDSAELFVLATGFRGGAAA